MQFCADSSTRVELGAWSSTSKRTGLIGRKVGMTRDWTDQGEHVPLTIIQVAQNEVVDVKHAAKHGYDALVLGFEPQKSQRLNKALRSYFEQQGVQPYKKLKEFHITPNAAVAVGTKLSSAHFVPGQFLDIVGTSKGKGFAGTIKRWGFSRQPSSHGNSKAHRKPGSIAHGAAKPGRVWKGRKMAGRMGGKQQTTQNLQLHKVDPEHNLLFVRGAVPGPRRGYVYCLDARLKLFESAPPFPTMPLDAIPEGEIVMDMDPAAPPVHADIKKSIWYQRRLEERLTCTTCPSCASDVIMRGRGRMVQKFL